MRLGRAAHEDDLAGRAGVEEAPHALARAFKGCGGRLAQGVHAAVHVRMRVRLVVLHRAQHRQRALRGGGAVQIHQRLAVDARGEDREVARARARHRAAGGRAVAERLAAITSSSSQGRVLAADVGEALARSGGAAAAVRSCATTSARNAHLSRRCAVSAVEPARQQVEQHVLVELAGGGAVAAAHIVGVDLKLRPHVDLRVRSGEQAAQRLLRVGARGGGRHHDLAVEGDACAPGGDAAEQSARCGCAARGARRARRCPAPAADPPAQRAPSTAAHAPRRGARRAWNARPLRPMATACTR